MRSYQKIKVTPIVSLIMYRKSYRTIKNEIKIALNLSFNRDENEHL